jgi:glycosyltransferase involved in cell wall biosynthesis
MLLDDMPVNQKKKILIVGLYPPPFSSGERVITQYFHDLLSPMHEVTPINMSIGILAPPKFKLSSIAYYVKTLINFAAVFHQVYFISRRQQFDLCYLTPSSSALGHLRDIIILKLLSKKVTKVLLNVQNGNYDVIFKRGWHHKLTLSFINRVTKVIFTSEILRKRAEPFISKEKAVIIRNSVDDKIKCTDLEVENVILAKANRAEFAICYISNMTPSKGYMDLFDALASIDQQDRTNLKVNFVGEWLSAEQLQEFNDAVDVAGLRTNIAIHGKVNDRAKLREFYLHSNVFILPTYFPQEAQPVSIIEALNAGVPVIATNHASIPDLITNKYNGLLVPIKSPENIKEAILTLLKDKEVWQAMSKNARTSFNESFTAEKIRANILMLFDQELTN